MKKEIKTYVRADGVDSIVSFEFVFKNLKQKDGKICGRKLC